MQERCKICYQPKQPKQPKQKSKAKTENRALRALMNPARYARGSITRKTLVPENNNITTSGAWNGSERRRRLARVNKC